MVYGYVSGLRLGLRVRHVKSKQLARPSRILRVLSPYPPRIPFHFARIRISLPSIAKDILYINIEERLSGPWARKRGGIYCVSFS